MQMYVTSSPFISSCVNFRVEFFLHIQNPYWIAIAVCGESAESFINTRKLTWGELPRVGGNVKRRGWKDGPVNGAVDVDEKLRGQATFLMQKS